MGTTFAKRDGEIGGSVGRDGKGGKEVIYMIMNMIMRSDVIKIMPNIVIIKP